MSKTIQVEQESEPELNIFICDADEHMLDPLEQIKYSLNEVQVTYGPIVKLKDAP